MKPESAPLTSPVLDHLEQLRREFAEVKISLEPGTGRPRSVMIVADTDVECDVLSLDNFDRLGIMHPSPKIKLLQNLNLSLCHRLRKANRELSLFD